ncbi:uncharacterized protein LOC121745825 [Salvia splendens]|uniref:uncharacterized protein LOC121745825 n=1 Tax=Salvia splendens TaxID=180675 RepID=UPI001C272075|nr:uncharacterized protein LOC121745825 [Salvia splendens]
MAENITFRGKSTDDPNKHITKFIQICNTTKLNGVTDEQIRLRLFPFSLEDSAKDLLESLEPGSIRTWDAMVEKFLEKFYPPSEAIKRQHEILAFQMNPAKNIREAWGRFKALMKRCPNHGLTPTVQVITFFKGYVPEAQRELNLSSGGNILKKGVNEAMEVIEELASNDERWSNDRSKVHRVASTTDHGPMSALSDKLDALTMKFDCMAMGQPSREHQGKMGDVNYVNQGDNNQYFNNHRPNFQGGGYNQFGNKGHPNLSYGNPNNALQPPPGFTVTDGVVNDPKKMTTEDILKSYMLQSNKLMEQNNQRMENVETDVQSMAIHLKNIDTQISQISQTVTPSLPATISDTVLEPKAVVAEKEKEAEKENTGTTSGVKVSFPQVLNQKKKKKKKKKDEQFTRFLDIFRKVHVNIPLIEALQQMPKYAKFLKEMIAQKTSWGQVDTINLTENCSALLQRKLPAKLKDPGSFTVDCLIGGYKVENALCDLGASINLMQLSVFKQLNIGTLKPTSATLQMADRSVAYPEGIVEDLLIKAGEFIFPVDFMVLDMEEDKGVPLLLGRPFLATVEANINVKKGELTIFIGEESQKFSHKPRSMDGRTEECKVVRLKHQVITEEGGSSAVRKVKQKDFYELHMEMMASTNSEPIAWIDADHSCPSPVHSVIITEPPRMGGKIPIAAKGRKTTAPTLKEPISREPEKWWLTKIWNDLFPHGGNYGMKGDLG